MAKRPTSVTVKGQTYTLGDTVHYYVHGLGTVENILALIRRDRTGGHLFIMRDGEKVLQQFMIESCSQAVA